MFFVLIFDVSFFAINIFITSVKKYVAKIVAKKDKTPSELFLLRLGTTTKITPAQNKRTAIFMMFNANPLMKSPV